MIRTERLKWEIAARGMSTDEVAWHLGMSKKRFEGKLRKGQFGTDDIQDLTDLLELERPEEIFFSNCERFC